MTPLLLIGLAWLIGLALGHLPEPGLGLLWLGLAAALAALHHARLPLPLPLALLTLGVAALGLWRGLPAAPAALPLLPSGVTAVRGTIVTAPVEYETGASAVLHLSTVRVGSQWQPFDGRLRAWLPLAPALSVGDAIEIPARPRATGAVANAARAERLRRDGLAGEVWARQATVLGHEAPGGPAGWRLVGVQALTGLFDRMLPVPVAGLAAGMLIGERSGLPADLSADFRATGTAHLLVVSGSNMALVTGFLAGLGAGLGGRARGIWALVTLAAVAGYAFLVGGDPAVVRAAIMGGLAVAALAVGRRADPLLALILAAAVMAGLQPSVLGDLGFRLSFLATLGLVLVVPPVATRLAAWPRPARLAAEALAATLAAQVAVEPLLAHATGQLTPIAPLINLLVAPFVPLVMLGGALLALVGLPGLPLLTELAAWVTTAAALPLVLLVQTGARLPLAGVLVPPPSAAAVLAIYAGLLLLAAPLLTAAPAATLRRGLVAARPALPALGLLGLAGAAVAVWLAVLTP